MFQSKIHLPRFNINLRFRKNNEERIVSLKKASLEQFSKIHNQIKSINNSVKYNNKLVNEVKLDKDKLEHLCKNNEKVMKGITEQLNSIKAKMSEIEESYSHFNKHKRDLNLNLISKPIKHAEAIKSQLVNDIEKIHTEVKDELKQKLKRIILCENSIKRISKDLNDLLAKLSNSGDINNLAKGKQGIDKEYLQKVQKDILNIK